MDLRLIDAAVSRARAAASAPQVNRERDGHTRTRRLAIGDPQAPLERFFAVLTRHGALGDDGLLQRDVALVSVGDHFDWGRPHERERATRDATALLAWLALHPVDQVTLLLGNHDLGRVGELVHYDDAQFAALRDEADAIYRSEHAGSAVAREREAALRAAHPEIVSAELLSRDFSTFESAQRDLVVRLLRKRRFRLAHASGPSVLVCHAGVTRDDLALAGLGPDERADAPRAAQALNDALDAAVDAWHGAAPFAIGALHVPGSGDFGEGRGMLYHRPSNPAFEAPALFEGPPRRRYDPRWIPRGIVQVVGHLRDSKCRALLQGWHDGAPPRDGVLRTLRTDGARVQYAHGVDATIGPDEAAMVFIDGAMNEGDPSAYALLDLDTMCEARAID